jgi:hypothetical protein
MTGIRVFAVDYRLYSVIITKKGEEEKKLFDYRKKFPSIEEASDFMEEISKLENFKDADIVYLQRMHRSGIEVFNRKEERKAKELEETIKAINMRRRKEVSKTIAS